jgi:uncharacterized protein
MIRLVWIFLCGVFLPSAVHAASFDCQKAASPIEKLICHDPQLSKNDEDLAAAYTKALNDAADPAGIKKRQREWLAEVRNRCDGIVCLKEAYAAQIAQLASIKKTVIPKPVSASSSVVVRTLHQADFSLPFVETNPPEAGRRINAQISGATGNQSFSAAQAAFSKLSPDDRGLISESYSIVRNDGRLLVLQFESEGCGAYCSTSSEQKIFDARTGHLVHPEELFTDKGIAILSQRLKENRIHRAKAILATQKNSEADEADMYARCIAEWTSWPASLWPLNSNPDGRWRFVAGSCSNHAMRPYDALDNLDQIAALPELKPYLNAYGKSLLLGEGDVRDPAPEAPPPCKQGGGLPVTKNNRAPQAGVQASAGESHFLLLNGKGQLWGWGESHSGELGAGSGYVPTPTLLGDDFVQAGGGHSYTAAIRRDGTLWTWGSNYQGRLGAGNAKSSAQPVRIGEGFVSLKVESDGAMALRKDGSVWGWGGKMTTPQQLMTDVVQIEYGPRGERLMLKKDGSIWALGGFSTPGQKPYDATQPRLIGNGFARLATHNGDLAYKVDGSLWAWGEILSGMQSDAAGQESFDHAVEIGSGFVTVKVGGVYSLYLAALKADGSLWLARTRGMTTRLESNGCGYVDMVAGGNYLLLLKADGSLEVWGNWKTPTVAGGQNELDLRRQPLSELTPVSLGKGFTQLFQVGDIWGDMGAKAIVLRNDGSVWLWNAPWAPETGGPLDWFKPVPFPKEAKIAR